MKKNILTALFISIANLAVACDICGCGVGSYYLGILPDFNKKVTGIRYRYSSLKSHVGIGGSTTYLTTKEKYQTTEWWGALNLGTSFRIMASVPFHFISKANQGQTYSKSGFGDIAATGFYRIMNSRKTVSGNRLLVQSCWMGAGIKAPSGHYNNEDKSNGASNANLFQLGTGSTDFTLNLMYDIRLQDAGINVNSNYKINTANKFGFQYGNKFSSTVQAYYKFRLKNGLSIAPNAGWVFETSRHDKENGIVSDLSGGHLHFALAGFETMYRKLSFGANFQHPFSQGLAKGIISANNKGMLHVAVLL